MEIVKIKKSNKEEIHKLEVEENAQLNKFSSFSIYKVELTNKLFDKLFSNRFLPGCVYLGIKENGKIIATISGHEKAVPKTNVAYIDNILVTKKHQGKGYSKILINEFFKRMKERGLKYCQLDVKENNPAKKIYEKWDFITEQIQMTKKL